MRCYPLAVICVLAFSLLASAAEKPPKPVADPVMVVMELSQVEVNLVKLRQMGIDWKTLTQHEKIAGNPAWFREFVELLVQNDLARNHGILSRGRQDNAGAKRLSTEIPSRLTRQIVVGDFNQAYRIRSGMH